MKTGNNFYWWIGFSEDDDTRFAEGAIIWRLSRYRQRVGDNAFHLGVTQNTAQFPFGVF